MTAALSSLRAGIGKREITWRDPSRRVRDPLYAKVLLLDDGATRVALITMDVVAIGGICDVSDAFLPALRVQLKEKAGVPAANVIVNASHTHPPDRILCDEAELVARVTEAVCDAAEALIPVRVGAGRGREDRIAMNRNLELRNGRLWTIRHSNPSPPEEMIDRMRPTDPEVGILRVDRMDGSPYAVVYHFACHLLFGNPEGDITANFVGIASGLIEEVLGQGATAFYLQGCAGDVIDVGFKDLYRVRDIEPFGQRLALAVLKELPQIATEEGGLELISEEVELPRRSDFADRTAALEAEQRELLSSLRFTTLNFQSFMPLYLQQRLKPEYPSADAYTYLQAAQVGNGLPEGMDKVNRMLVDQYLQNVRAMERLAHIQDDLATVARHEAINLEAGSATITAELHGLKVGNFVWLTAPIEVLVEVGLKVKRASPHRYTFVSGFTNGYMHYGPPATDYPSGSYEVTECFLAPEWEAIFEKQAGGILRALGGELSNPEGAGLRGAE